LIVNKSVLNWTQVCLLHCKPQLYEIYAMQSILLKMIICNHNDWWQHPNPLKTDNEIKNLEPKWETVGWKVNKTAKGIQRPSEKF
jgi:hypothetical protein